MFHLDYNYHFITRLNLLVNRLIFCNYSISVYIYKRILELAMKFKQSRNAVYITIQYNIRRNGRKIRNTFNFRER